ncbi:hypothetical protein GCM10011273_03140 [Asticcacaulis endophyticus]|uniref:Uncharacterized protein n=1 Tax=Asticcacaulis endophyticus TaxID=1395890 RepID=A0A918UN45_9CAUL|nr:hypothetical protein GCM10011273_03140 [Asticcacaulis endophyticus]
MIFVSTVAIARLLCYAFTVSRAPLTDRQIYDLLHQVSLLLRDHSGQTVHGDTAIKALTEHVGLIKTAILIISERSGPDAPPYPELHRPDGSGPSSEPES